MTQNRHSPFLLAGLTALAFGCLLAVARASSLVPGVPFASQAPSLALAGAAAATRLAMLAAIALLVCRKGRQMATWSFALAAALLLVGVGGLAALPFAGDATPLQIILAALAGAGEGCLLFFWVRELASTGAARCVLTVLAATVVAGLVVALAQATQGAGRVAVLVLAALVCGGFPLVLPRLKGSQDASEEAARAAYAASASLPWFSLVMVVACSFVGTLLYGMAQALFGMSVTAADPAWFGVTAAAGLALGVAVLTLAPDPARLSWLPPLALLLFALVVTLTTSWNSLAITLGALAGLMLGLHCLKWALIAVIASSAPNRDMVAALLVILCYGTLPYSLGCAFGEAVPLAPSSLSSAAGVMALVLVVILAAALVLARGHAAAPAPLAQRPAAPAKPTPDERLDELAARHGFTARELEIARLTARGNSSLRIAEILIISGSTVRFHQQNIYRKLDIHSRQDFFDLVNGETHGPGGSH